MSEARVRLRVGGMTDVGRARSNNQDSLLLGPRAFAVADGMGGHQGGEVASSVAVDTVRDTLGTDERLDVDGFVTAVEAANAAVLDRGAGAPNLAGMGTTFVGIAVVDTERPDGSGTEEVLAIVNVGDSRGYRYSQGNLDQITHDHSLVAELVRDGQITEAEAEVHPQRNIVTRALGIDPDLPVDHFEVLPRTGDRYLLCSDGLTNEVPAADITAVLRSIEDPGDAAAELVRMANENGGRDNITVVIADVLADGGLAERAAALVPDAESFSDAGETTATYAAVDAGLDDDDADGHGTDAGGARAVAAGADGPDGDGDGEPSRLLSHVRATSSDADKAPRAITARSIAFVVVVLGILGVGWWLVDNYATGTYVVTFDAGEVVIREGRDLLWYSDSIVERTGIGAEDVATIEDQRDEIDAGLTYTSLSAAQNYVEALRERLDSTVGPVDASDTGSEGDVSDTVDGTTPDDKVDPSGSGDGDSEPATSSGPTTSTKAPVTTRG